MVCVKLIDEKEVMMEQVIHKLTHLKDLIQLV